jgi:hypothetical protein
MALIRLRGQPKLMSVLDWSKRWGPNIKAGCFLKIRETAAQRRLLAWHIPDLCSRAGWLFPGFVDFNGYVHQAQVFGDFLFVGIRW